MEALNQGCGHHPEHFAAHQGTMTWILEHPLREEHKGEDRETFNRKTKEEYDELNI